MGFDVKRSGRAGEVDARASPPFRRAISAFPWRAAAISIIARTSMPPFPDTIRIGTLVRHQPGLESYLRQILPHGFESVSITFGADPGDEDTLLRAAEAVARALDGTGCVVSALGLYGNPLETDAAAQATRVGWERLLRLAPLFRTEVVAGFTGRLRGRPIPQSIARFVEIFRPLAQQARAAGLRIAFENCAMGGDWQSGDWNIAHNPAAWERMFDALPEDNLGLQWEPCHQMLQLIDPLPQLRRWVGRIFHVHGKDAQVRHDLLAEHGIAAGRPFAWHRTPGFGDSDWTAIISELRLGGFRGSIDIEGWHDPVYRDHLEMTGQVHALRHLQRCRGAWVANPEVD
jgi:sugar phosphate isomerase/epimerase